MLDTEALHRIGIDTEEGIAYCADDPEFYEDMLREYLQESDGRAAVLRGGGSGIGYPAGKDQQFTDPSHAGSRHRVADGLRTVMQTSE